MTTTLTAKRSNGRLLTAHKRAPELDQDFGDVDVEQDRLDADPGDDEADDDLDDEEDEQPDADEDQESGEVWDAEDESDDETEDQPEQEEEDQDADEEDQYGSLEELAAAIDDAYERSRRCHKQSNEHALRAGEYLLVVKQRVGHGKFGKWVANSVKVSLRQAERYMALFEGREQLDELNAGWQAEWSITQALANLGDQRDDQNDEDGEPPSGAAGDTADEEEQEDETEESFAEEATARRAQSRDEKEEGAESEEQQAAPD